MIKLFLIPGVIRNMIYQKIFIRRFIYNNPGFIKAFVLDEYSIKDIVNMLDWIINDLVNLLRNKYHLYNNMEQLATDCKNEILTIYRKKYKYDNVSVDLINLFIKEFIDNYKIKPKKYL